MLKFAGKSDKGLLRSHNEDAFCLIGGGDGAPLLLAVADGIGGHLAGDIASQTAISVIHDNLASNPLDASDKNVINARLIELNRAANEAVYRKSLTEPECVGMGTTLIIAVISEGNLAVSHIGDSCAYYMRDDELHKITTDHTYVEELIRIGSLTRDEAARHPKRNVITKAIGCMGRIEADLYWVELHDGDRIVLCTDGLSKMLTDYEIAEAVTAADDPDAICGTLITKSNHRGGLDNITVLVSLYAA
jgi:protein phosphatase